ncbi:hypothetical protein CDAR_113651 [Caerostris darwini]|uniref:Uncharacterized protein n=1 Tax=Caerostris darwini TaxID=1538125 RepID=A0AAV4UEW1_9ARAC|nr:hypothetical protein CDAR_113651 [Caerostris darwini]
MSAGGAEQLAWAQDTQSMYSKNTVHRHLLCQEEVQRLQTSMKICGRTVRNLERATDPAQTIKTLVATRRLQLWPAGRHATKYIPVAAK